MDTASVVVNWQVALSRTSSMSRSMERARVRTCFPLRLVNDGSEAASLPAPRPDHHVLRHVAHALAC